MYSEYIDKISELKSLGLSFATAIVVRNSPPSSGKPGDKAIIQADGRIYGWIGGGCAQPVVIKEAKQSIEDGKPRLVRITPNLDEKAKDGIILYNMACFSGGTLDIYIEPVLADPHLVIIGKSLIAQTLAKISKILGYNVTVLAPGADAEFFPGVNNIFNDINFDNISLSSNTYVVISTQGLYDEEALEQVVKLNVPYIAFVASKRKSEALFQYLSELGISSDKINNIRVPAGLDIKAKLPEEIAISILAEIIMVKQNIFEKKSNTEEKISMSAKDSKTAIDLVCGMSVDINLAEYVTDYKGQQYYFCCSGCMQSFNKEPEIYTNP